MLWSEGMFLKALWSGEKPRIPAGCFCLCYTLLTQEEYFRLSKLVYHLTHLLFGLRICMEAGNVLAGHCSFQHLILPGPIVIPQLWPSEELQMVICFNLPRQASLLLPEQHNVQQRTVQSHRHWHDCVCGSLWTSLAGKLLSAQRALPQSHSQFGQPEDETFRKMEVRRDFIFSLWNASECSAVESVTVVSVHMSNVMADVFCEFESVLGLFAHIPTLTSHRID